VISLSAAGINSIAVIGAHCDDIAIGAAATLIQFTRANPGLVVNALVLTGAGTEREVEEKNAFAAMCGNAEVRLTVADLPDARLPQHWGHVKRRVAEFRRTCEPELVIGPQRADAHQDHRLIAELVPTEFRDHLLLGYEIPKWETDTSAPSLFVPVSREVALRKAELLQQCYVSQVTRDWFDEEVFIATMRLRGVQCHQRYAEAFTAAKALLDLGGAGPV